jgi:hypothetical protein
METYEPPSSDEEQVTRKKKQKKDPNAPKRNMSAYFLYSQVIRPTIKEDHPTATFGETAKVRTNFETKRRSHFSLSLIVSHVI